MLLCGCCGRQWVRLAFHPDGPRTTYRWCHAAAAPSVAAAPSTYHRIVGQHGVLPSLEAEPLFLPPDRTEICVEFAVSGPKLREVGFKIDALPGGVASF